MFKYSHFVLVAHGSLSQKRHLVLFASAQSVRLDFAQSERSETRRGANLTERQKSVSFLIVECKGLAESNNPRADFAQATLPNKTIKYRFVRGRNETPKQQKQSERQRSEVNTCFCGAKSKTISPLLIKKTGFNTCLLYCNVNKGFKNQHQHSLLFDQY